MGMDGRYCFPGTLSTIARPTRASLPVHNLGDSTYSRLDGLFHPHGGRHWKLLFGHCCPRPNTTPNTMPLQRSQKRAVQERPPTCTYIHAFSRFVSCDQLSSASATDPDTRDIL